MTDTNNSQDKSQNQPSTSGNGQPTQPEAFHQGIAGGQPDQTEPNLKSNGQEEALSPQELAQIWAKRAYELAEEPPAPTLGQTMDLLVFWLAGERYGLEVTNVREIYPLEQLTPVPRTPNFVAGVFSARGRILSVVDLRAFMGLPATDLSDQTKIIVVGSTNSTSEPVQMEIGLLADEVADVLTVFKEDIDPPLTTHTDTRTEYIQGVTTDLLVVLDLNTLLNDKRLIVHEEII
jgi:purine-binding chemotaxis protein CheW